MSNSDNYKERQDVLNFQTDLFQKAPDQKVLIKLRVLSDDSVLIKCWSNKQALQKVLIEFSPGVVSTVYSMIGQNNQNRRIDFLPMFRF